MRRLVGTIIAVSVFVALPTAAHAQTTGGGSVSWDRPRAEVTASLGLASNTSGASWSGPVVRFFSKVFDAYCIYAGGGGCQPVVVVCDPSQPRDIQPVFIRPPDQGGPTVPPTVDGKIILYSTEPIGDPYDAYFGETAQRYCAGPSVAGAAVERPPSAQQIWDSARAAGTGAVVELQPTGHGLTGLNAPLWLTLGASTATDISTSFGVWNVTATVFLVRVDWRIADVASDTVVATEGSTPVVNGGVALGSRENPLAWFRFRTKGTYRVTGSAVWAARGTITGPFGFRESIDFPEAALSSSYDYPVDELVGVLDRTE